MASTALFKHRYLPASKPGPEEKLLVVFHGLGDSLNGFTWMPSSLGIADLSYLLINAPDDYYGGFSWFDFPADPLPGILRSRKLIAGLLDELVSQGIKPANLLLFGFSQGCLMAMDAGLHSNHALAGVCGVSGWVAFMEEYPGAFSSEALKRKFLVTHGLHDPLIPYESTAAQCKALREMGLDLDFRTYDKEHTMLPEEVQDIRDWLKARL